MKDNTQHTTQEDKMMDKSTILGYVVALLLPATIMYGTGYNGTVDALILTMVWILLVLSVLAIILIGFAGIAMASIGLGEKIPQEVKTRMETAKANLGRWWITVIFVGWMLVALSSVGWTATAITYFIIILISQITTRLFVNTFTSMEAKLDAKT